MKFIRGPNLSDDELDGVSGGVCDAHTCEDFLCNEYGVCAEQEHTACPELDVGDLLKTIPIPNVPCVLKKNKK